RVHADGTREMIERSFGPSGARLGEGGPGGGPPRGPPLSFICNPAARPAFA
ncbi:hypothetical protein ACRCRN_25465, partial [Pseudomonas aeruginosa]